MQLNLTNQTSITLDTFHSIVTASATTSGGGSLSANRVAFRIVWDGRPTPLKDAVVVIPCSNEIEMFFQPRVVQHLVRVAAYGVYLPSFKVVMLV